MKEIPVYLFTGFLEAGKTTALRAALADKEFSAGEKTLLLLCEEGIEEYDAERFASPVVIAPVEDELSLTPDRLSALAKRNGADRVIIEYNGMWQLNSIFRALPEGWTVVQEIFFADATTILTYNANMRAMVVDKLQSCDLVVLNRVTDETDKMPLHKLVRAISRRADIEYDYTDGRAVIDDFVDPLPFDLNADVIEIADGDYAVWFQDIMDDMLKYDTKTVRFKGIVAVDNSFPVNTMAVGRHIMTCCADDIQYAAFVCKWKKAGTMKARDWVTVTAKISIEFNKLYGREGPVLVATRVEYAEKPNPELATFN